MRKLCSVLINSLIIVVAAGSGFASAETVINNYGSNSQPQDQPQSQGQSSNNGYETDPRVPPAGAYSTRNSDGSSEQLYTTGDKKPYYVDNPNSQQAQTPQVFVQPTMPTPSPAPNPPLRSTR